MTMPIESADSTSESDRPDRQIRFLVHAPGNWGNGFTLDEAIDNCPSGKKGSLVFMWPGPDFPNKAWVNPMGMHWEGTEARPVLIQDHRSAQLRKDFPFEIGSPAM